MVFHQNRHEPRLLALSVWARCSLAVDFPTAPTVSMRLSRNSQWRRVSNPRADLVLVCSRLAARFADVRNFPAFFPIIPVATAPSHESCPRRSKLLSLVIEHDFPWSVISSNLRKNTLRYPFKCLHLVCCLSRWNKKFGNANVSQWRSLEKPGLRRKAHTGLIIICFAAYGMSLCAHALLLLVCLFRVASHCKHNGAAMSWKVTMRTALTSSACCLPEVELRQRKTGTRASDWSPWYWKDWTVWPKCKL